MTRRRKAIIAATGAVVMSGGLATGVSMTAHAINDVGRTTNNCRNAQRDFADDSIVGRAKLSLKNCGTSRFRIG